MPQDFDLLKQAVKTENMESAQAILKSNPQAVQEFLEKWPQLSEALAKLLGDTKQKQVKSKPLADE